MYLALFIFLDYCQYVARISDFEKPRVIRERNIGPCCHRQAQIIEVGGIERDVVIAIVT